MKDPQRLLDLNVLKSLIYNVFLNISKVLVILVQKTTRFQYWNCPEMCLKMLYIYIFDKTVCCRFNIKPLSYQICLNLNKMCNKHACAYLKTGTSNRNLIGAKKCTEKYVSFIVLFIYLKSNYSKLLPKKIISYIICLQFSFK